jgi:hypothetical protein
MERKIITLLAIIAASFTFAQFPHTRVYSTFDNLPLTQSDTFIMVQIEVVALPIMVVFLIMNIRI